ncbi:MAG: 30S ribosomal protein S12 methylthiotransferase RimO [Bacteroidetes bacterium]|nr:MAG: 30S ribosomal protein S12 methylthiotransferase RimO [Bacteroidota bacterium]
MFMNNISKSRINFITMGCSKNLVDSEKVMAQLKMNNLEVTHESGEIADYVVVNTCGFIQDSKEESIEVILNLLDKKAEGEIRKVFVMGCLSERYLDELKSEFVDLDGIYGVNDMQQIVEDIGADYKKELIGERMLTTPKHYAYLKVSEGCDRTCAFCAIPNIRGKNVSLSIEALTNETIQLAKKGVKELILIAQDLTYYGVDLYGRKRLGDLLKELVKVEGIEWIRLHYTYPTQFPNDVLELMKNETKICHYMDIPLQHINDRILTSMRRGHSGDTTRKLVDRFRNYVPDINIRTTLIVGYPGETEVEFNELLDFVKKYKFDRLGAFTYSPEEGTPAFVIEDDVPEEVKIDRLNQLMDIQEQISLDKNEARIGNTYKVLIDKYENGNYYGRTQYDSPEVDNEVIINNETELEIGEFYQVLVSEAEAFDLIGSVIK